MISWSLKAKLTFMGLCVALLSASSGAIGFFFLDTVSTQYGVVAEENVPSLKELADLRATIRELRIQVRSISLFQNTQNDVNVYIEASKKQIENFESHILAYEKIDEHAKDRESFKEFLLGWNEFKSFGVELLTLAQNYSANEVQIAAMIRNVCPQKAQKVYNPLLAETEYQVKFADQSTQAAHSAEKKARSWVSIFASISILLAGAVSFLASSSIAKEVEVICDSLALNSQDVHSASSSLSNASNIVQDGSNKAASMLESSTSSISQIEDIVKLSSEKASQAKSASQNSKDSALDGSQAVEKLMNSMEKIDQSSRKMQDIINIIEDISFQTNLLSLNAAVEAARAGESGKGFAVVADAVRMLAQRSSESAKQISVLISDSALFISDGVEKAKLSQDVLNRIQKDIEQVSHFNQEIAFSSEEQKIGIQKVSSALVSLDSTSHSNTQASEQVANIAKKLNEKTEAVDALIFKLRAMIEGKQRNKAS